MIETVEKTAIEEELEEMEQVIFVDISCENCNEYDRAIFATSYEGFSCIWKAVFDGTVIKLYAFKNMEWNIIVDDLIVPENKNLMIVLNDFCRKFHWFMWEE